jgi:hypothetical protein
VSPPQRQQPALDRALRVFGARHVAQALGDNRVDGRQRILDAVVQFLENQLLELVGRLALHGVNTGLGEQFPRIDFGLLKQQPKADVLRLQNLMVRRVETSMALVLMKVSSKHEQVYHLNVGYRSEQSRRHWYTTG